VNPSQIQAFCRRYFQEVGAPILREEPEYMQVQLPRDVDKELIDRPFYWKWVETMGQEVEPTILHLVFKPDRKVPDVTRLHYVGLGNTHLERIFQSCRNRGRIVRLFEAETTKGDATRGVSRWIPYFVANVKISYLSDSRRDVFACDAVDMETGTILHGVWEQLIQRHLVAHLPGSVPPGQGNSARHPTIRGLPLNDTERWKLLCQTAWEDLKDAIREAIETDDHTWANVASAGLEADRKQLETYYDHLLQGAKTPEEIAAYETERATRIQELVWRRQPRIQIAPFSVGLFFLKTPLRNRDEMTHYRSRN
jgi:hypothetical protein